MADPAARIDAAIDRIVAAASACLDDSVALRRRNAALRDAVASAVGALDEQILRRDARTGDDS